MKEIQKIIDFFSNINEARSCSKSREELLEKMYHLFFELSEAPQPELFSDKFVRLKALLPVFWKNLLDHLDVQVCDNKQSQLLFQVMVYHFIFSYYQYGVYSSKRLNAFSSCRLDDFSFKGFCELKATCLGDKDAVDDEFKFILNFYYIKIMELNLYISASNVFLEKSPSKQYRKIEFDLFQSSLAEFQIDLMNSLIKINQRYSWMLTQVIEQLLLNCTRIILQHAKENGRGSKIPPRLIEAASSLAVLLGKNPPFYIRMLAKNAYFTIFAFLAWQQGWTLGWKKFSRELIKDNALISKKISILKGNDQQQRGSRQLALVKCANIGLIAIFSKNFTGFNQEFIRVLKIVEEKKDNLHQTAQSYYFSAIRYFLSISYFSKIYYGEEFPSNIGDHLFSDGHIEALESVIPFSFLDIYASDFLHLLLNLTYSQSSVDKADIQDKTNQLYFFTEQLASYFHYAKANLLVFNNFCTDNVNQLNALLKECIQYFCDAKKKQGGEQFELENKILELASDGKRPLDFSDHPDLYKPLFIFFSIAFQFLEMTTASLADHFSVPENTQICKIMARDLFSAIKYFLGFNQHGSIKKSSGIDSFFKLMEQWIGFLFRGIADQETQGSCYFSYYFAKYLFCKKDINAMLSYFLKVMSCYSENDQCYIRSAGYLRKIVLRSEGFPTNSRAILLEKLMKNAGERNCYHHDLKLLEGLVEFFKIDQFLQEKKSDLLCMLFYGIIFSLERENIPVHYNKIIKLLDQVIFGACHPRQASLPLKILTLEKQGGISSEDRLKNNLSKIVQAAIDKEKIQLIARILLIDPQLEMTVEQLTVLGNRIVAIAGEFIKQCDQNKEKQQFVVSSLQPRTTKKRRKGQFFLVDLFREAIYCGPYKRQSYQQAMQILEKAGFNIAYRSKKQSFYKHTRLARMVGGARQNQKSKPTERPTGFKVANCSICYPSNSS